MNPNLKKIQSKRRAGPIVALAIALLIAFAAVLIFTRPVLPSARGPKPSSLRVTSSSFPNGGPIPPRYTCGGDDISPSLAWAGSPARTKSFAVVMYDPDAADFTHWLVYNIPPGVRALVEGASEHGAMPGDAAQGTNSFGAAGYGGPCPPAGESHHYVFHIYALDARLDLPPGATRDALDSAIGHHVLAEGQIVGLYRR